MVSILNCTTSFFALLLSVQTPTNAEEETKQSLPPVEIELAPEDSPKQNPTHRSPDDTNTATDRDSNPSMIPKISLGTANQLNQTSPLPPNKSEVDPLLRGLAPARRAATNTVIGGYGQFNLTSLRVGPDSVGDFETRANIRRLVLFVAHDLSNTIDLYTELEWENAIACQSCKGSVEIEQALIDWRLWRDAFVLRAGLLLVPMGILNQWHEPPIFNGVERPGFDRVIIPSTWRELGIGFTGKFATYFQYELYAITPLDPTRLGPNGIIGGRSLGSLAKSNTVAITGRLEAEPILGLVIGAAGYFSDLGNNGEFYRANGTKRKLRLPLIGYAVDARIKKMGIEARAVWGQFFLENAGSLTLAHREDGSRWYPNAAEVGAIPKRTQGGYVEAGYNVFFPVPTTRYELVPFVRAEMYNTQAKVPRGFQRKKSFDVQELTMGLSFRPLRSLVFKFDVQLRDRRLGYDEVQINAGTGFMM